MTDLVVRQFAGRRALLLALAILAGTQARPAEAQQQFTLVDSTYTATSQNTTSSRYAITPLPATPSNWKTPFDYTTGSIWVRFEVLEKPSTQPTYYGICFETANVLTCMPYPPLYSKPGVYMSTPQLKDFWQYDMFDWTKRIDHVLVVLKNQSMQEIQGDPNFYPTKIHVTVAVVPPGKSYVPDDDDAGTPAMMPATNTKPPSASGGSIAPPPFTKPSVRDAGAPSSSSGNAGSGLPRSAANAGGRTATADGSLSAAADAGVKHVPVIPGPSCAVQRVRAGRGDGSWLALLGAGLALRLAHRRGARTRKRRARKR